MPKNWEQREKKLSRRKDAMKVNSRGLITVIQPIIAKKGRAAKEKQRERQDRVV
jgi:hypothetical protein